MFRKLVCLSTFGREAGGLRVGRRRANGCSNAVEGWGAGVPGPRSAPYSQGPETKVCWVFAGPKGQISARFFFHTRFRLYVVRVCLSWAWTRPALSRRVGHLGPLMLTKPGSGRPLPRLFHHTSPSLEFANESQMFGRVEPVCDQRLIVWYRGGWHRCLQPT